MKKLLIEGLKLIQKRLQDDDCVISEEAVYEILELSERIAASNEPLTKAEVANLLPCSTKTVERLVAEGVLREGRKRLGHSTLYWKRVDVAECKRELRRLGRKLGDC